MERVFAADRCIGPPTGVEQPLPVRRVARQARRVQAEDNAEAARCNFGDHSLEAFATPRRRGTVADIGVDHDDVSRGPTERNGAVAPRVLMLDLISLLSG